jgi:hypothetical protein
MGLTKYFLPKDVVQAEKEIHCGNYLLERMKIALIYGEFDEALRFTLDFANTLRELQKMNQKKQMDDKLAAFLHELNTKGINAQTVRKSMFDKRV